MQFGVIYDQVFAWFASLARCFPIMLELVQICEQLIEFFINLL